MDGRVQLPVLHWIRSQRNVDFVDVITEAGMDGVLANQKDISEIIRSIKISIGLNGSSKIFVVGHFDCRGNPVNKKAHRNHVIKAVKRLKTYWPDFDITGLWVNKSWQVEVCCK